MKHDRSGCSRVPGATAVATVLCLMLAACGGGGGGSSGGGDETVNPPPASGSATLTWEAPNQNSDSSCLTNLVSYRLHYGRTAGVYTNTDTVAVSALNCSASGQTNACGSIATCRYTINGLEPGTWHFSIQAVNGGGEESAYSNVATKLVQ